MKLRRRLACCTRDREISLDLDQQERIMTYNGLESYLLNSLSYENASGTSRGDECASVSLDEDASSSSSNVETMKERFAKLLLGEDVSGGRKGLSSALALSNAITTLAASVFGELWKLEPLPEAIKSKWRREMDWLLAPTNYMVQLVPAKQNGANGQVVEIMVPKARSDIHMNLPALKKLDSMLIETLDSMVGTEFWYAEVGSRAEGRNKSAGQSRRWWVPSPEVPTFGLSEPERKKLLHKGKVVHQVFKAAQSINETVLLEMPMPIIIRDALPKSAKASLGEELYRVLSGQSKSVKDMLNSLNMMSEHRALETINRLEAAILAWKERIAVQSCGKSPVRTPLSLIKDSMSEQDKMQILVDRAETLIQQLKARHPNLPHTFLDMVKIRYGKDVGHSILEAYSRVLRDLAFRILSRIGEILQEDVLSNPSSPVPTCCFPGINLTWISDSPVHRDRVRHSLIDQINRTDGQYSKFSTSVSSDSGNSCAELKNQFSDCHRVISGYAVSP
ncbi:hypothetical protein NMG60_11000735 [Bertholletia excelsa]